MNLREDRWFVRFRGHTLGPLTTDQVMTSLRNRELTDADKIASSQNPAWGQIGAHPAFAPFTTSLREPVRKLAPIPSPQEIYQRKARHRAAALPTLAHETPRAPAAPAPVFAFRSEEPAPAREEISAATTAAAPSAKKKRVAGPGKKLGRPRKYPRPAELAASEADASAEASVELTVAPLPLRPAAALAAFDAEVAAPTTAPITAAPAPVPAREELPEEPAQDPAAVVEEAPLTPAPKVEAAPVSEAPAPAPAPSEKPSEKLAVESLALLESLRDWRRKEEELAQELGQSLKARGAVAPERPAMMREEIYDPAPARAAPALVYENEERPARFAALAAHLRAPRTNARFALLTAALAMLTAAAVFFVVEKTRGPENRSFPNPSGPTAQPTSKEDPTPSLRAPTRPQRD